MILFEYETYSNCNGVRGTFTTIENHEKCKVEGTGIRIVNVEKKMSGTFS